MSDETHAGAVLYAKDLPRVSDFYASVVGLTVTHREGDHVLLAGRALDLVIQAIPASIADAIEITTPPTRREETPIKLIFPVASISAVREAAARYGGEIDPPHREWRYRGSRV